MREQVLMGDQAATVRPAERTTAMRVAVLSALASACGPSLATDGHSQASSTTALESETGDDSRRLETSSSVIISVELNQALPHAAVVQLSGALASCGNLDDPEPCECQTHPPD